MIRFFVSQSCLDFSSSAHMCVFVCAFVSQDFPVSLTLSYPHLKFVL